MSRILSVLVSLCLLLVAALVQPNQAHAEVDVRPAPTTQKRPARTVLGAEDATPGPAVLSPAATTEETSAVSRINSFRRRAGLDPVVLAGAPSGLVSHAKYLNQNISSSTLDIYSEDPSLPGYTSAGAAIAGDTQNVSADEGSYARIVDYLMGDPQSRSWFLLNPWVTRVAFVRYGAVVSIWFPTDAAEATTPDPVVSPTGDLFPLSTMPADLAPYYTQNCQSRSSWGTPITFQFYPGSVGRVEIAEYSVKVDGRAIYACAVSEMSVTDTYGLAALIPGQPLPAGAHIQVRAVLNVYSRDGSSARTTTQYADFTTVAGSARTPGDQTGDGVADILAVDTNGILRLYKGAKPGVISHGWQVGHGWADFTWISRVPDVTGDRRDDLLGRKRDGSLWLYTGNAMGFFHSGRQVGWNWNGLRNLTVLGDMNADGKPELVGIITSGPDAGRLARYTVTGTGITGKALIGQGWQTTTMVSRIGDFDGNGTPDFLGVNNVGRLMAYYTGGGRVTRSVQIGNGWTGWSALYSPGDLNGDGRADLIGRDPAGDLWSWEGRPNALANKRQAGNGWNVIRLFG